MTIKVGALSNVLYQGLAADTKPTRTAGTVQGSIPKMNDVFFETDTQKWYIFDGDATWNPTAASAPYVVPPMA